jgi:hypothetical protein
MNGVIMPARVGAPDTVNIDVFEFVSTPSTPLAHSLRAG